MGHCLVCWPHDAPRWVHMSGNSGMSGYGIAAGRSSDQRRTGMFCTHMRKSHSWASALVQHRTCHRPTGGAPVGTGTCSCQGCSHTDRHRALVPAHTRLYLLSQQDQHREREIGKKKGNKVEMKINRWKEGMRKYTRWVAISQKHLLCKIILLSEFIDCSWTDLFVL